MRPAPSAARSSWDGKLGADRPAARRHRLLLVPPAQGVTTGDGGMLTTNNPELRRAVPAAAPARHERARHGAPRRARGDLRRARRCSASTTGMTDMQAAVGREQLKRLPEIVASAARSGRALRRAARPTSPGSAAVRAGLGPQQLAELLRAAARLVRPARRHAGRCSTDGIATRRGIMCAHREAPYATQAKPLASARVRARAGSHHHPAALPADDRRRAGLCLRRRARGLPQIARGDGDRALPAEVPRLRCCRRRSRISKSSSSTIRRPTYSLEAGNASLEGPTMPSLKNLALKVVDRTGNLLLRPPYGGASFFRNHGARSERKVSLTFDDGPSKPSTEIVPRCARRARRQGDLLLRWYQREEPSGSHPSRAPRRSHHREPLDGAQPLVRPQAAWRRAHRRRVARISAILGQRPCLYRPPWGWLTPWEGAPAHRSRLHDRRVGRVHDRLADPRAGRRAGCRLCDPRREVGLDPAPSRRAAASEELDEERDRTHAAQARPRAARRRLRVRHDSRVARCAGVRAAGATAAVA